MDRETIERTFDPEAGAEDRRAATPRPAAVSEVQLGRAVTAAASHFDRRDAIQAVADSLPEGAPGAEVERLADAFLASDSVIQIARERAKAPATRPGESGSLSARRWRQSSECERRDRPRQGS